MVGQHGTLKRQRMDTQYHQGSHTHPHNIFSSLAALKQREYRLGIENDILKLCLRHCEL
jgi:hypothetical protein